MWLRRRNRIKHFVCEILAEINREVVRTIYTNAEKVHRRHVTNGGIFDLDTDSNGRWSVERFKVDV